MFVDLLFFNRSVSEQCADLVNANVLTEEQVKSILKQGVESYKK